MRSLVLAASAWALLLAPSWAQQTAAMPSFETEVMAAGYKALMVCGAVHNARANGVERTLDSVQANELVGIYPGLDGVVRDLPVRVTADGVTVPAEGHRPERRAVYVAGRGCAILPVGGSSRHPGSEPLARRVDAPEWRVGQPRGDDAALRRALTRARNGSLGEGGNTTALVVVQDGRIVGEWYKVGFGPDTPQRTWSVAKSLAGTFVGWRVLEDRLAPNAPLNMGGHDHDPRNAITLDHFLRMSSGLTSDTAGNRTDGIYFGGALVSDAQAWPLIAAPGSRYRYANNDILLAVLATRPRTEADEPNALFDQMGMSHTVAETDWQGRYVLSSQVWSTARDLARFGQFYLDGGVAEGRRLIPEDWPAYVSRPSGPQPGGAQGYGATFWLMNRSEGVPPDTISANGNRGQYVVIVPSRNIVIVRRGEDPAGAGFDHIALTREVLAALD